MSLTNLLANPDKILKNFPKYGEVPNSKKVIYNTFKIASYSIIEALSSAIVGFVDMAMVGSFSTLAIAAIGLTNQPRMIFLAIFFAMQSAIIAIIARRFGEGDKTGANNCMMLSLSIGIVLASILSVVGFIFAEQIMTLVGADASTIADSTIYFKIIMIANVFVSLTQIINASLRAIGKTRITLKTSLIANGVNIVFNYLLINGNLGFPKLGVAGAAIATTLGFAVAFCVALSSICKKDGYLRFEFKKLFIFDKKTLSIFTKLSSSGIVEQLCVRFGFLLFAMIVAELGPDAFTAHQIGMNVIILSFAIGDGLGIASSSLTGQSLGQKRPDLALLYSRTCQNIGVCFGIVLAIIFVTLAKPIYMIFSVPPHILEMGIPIMYICAIITNMQIFQCTSAGALRGAGDVKVIALISFVSITLVRPILGYVFCFTLGWGLTGVWIALLCDQFTRFALSHLRYMSRKWLKTSV